MAGLLNGCRRAEKTAIGPNSTSNDALDLSSWV